MAEGSKKRSKSQRIGYRGEAAFKTAASRVGLLPTKVEEDFGLDFICTIERRLEEASTGAISGLYIGAAVRSSQSRKGRVRFKRKDIEYLLSCRIPVLLVLSHVHQANSEQVYVRLLDSDMALELAEFLASDKKKVSFTPSDFLSYEEIPVLIENAITPNFIDSIRLTIAKFGLAQVLPDVHIELLVSDKGQLSLIKTTDFFAQFDTKDRQHDLRLAMFGSPNKMEKRIQRLAINRDLLSHLKKLPQPLVIAGPLKERDVTLAIAGNERTTKCNFTQRLVGDYFGYVHKSGFSIQISKALPHEGQMVHWIDAHIDPDEKVQLTKHPDLFNFLRKCTKEHRWGEIGNSHTYPVETCGKLGLFGALALYLWKSRKIAPWIHEDVHIGNARSNEILNTLALVGSLGDDSKSFNGMGFSLVDENFPTKQTHMMIPIIANLESIGLVLFVKVICTLIMKEKQIAGLKIFDIEDISIKKHPTLFKKISDEPEMIINKNWPVIQLGPSPIIGKPDTSSCEYEAIILGDLEDEKH